MTVRGVVAMLKVFWQYTDNEQKKSYATGE